MSLCRRIRLFPRPFAPRTAARLMSRFGLAFVAAVGCGDPPVIPPPALIVGAIGVDDGVRVVERGTRDTLTATVLDQDGDTVQVPVVWRSSNERVAIFERGGVLVALDTGVTVVTASALGVTSAPTAFGVVWLGPAFIDSLSFTVPPALNPGATLTDSVRVQVLNVDSVPVANARVAFTVTGGGGTVAPLIAVTDASGIAAAQWTLGPLTGQNTLSASVVRADSTPDPLVTSNEVLFRVTAYEALTVADGNGQTGQILADLPVIPAVRLVDSLGNPRAGIPIQFTALDGGRVATPIVSTDANGVARSGTWTLGDIPGTQRLEARVSDARVTLTATATGTPIRYTPVAARAGGFSSCALESDGVVKCWGDASQTGTGAAANSPTPTAVDAPVTATSLVSGVTHHCAITSSGALWCWGTNAMTDTSGATMNSPVPTRMPSDIVWTSVTAGFAHNCGISSAGVTYCWGLNQFGQLGDGTNTNRFVPATVSGGFTFASVTAGTAHSCALSAGGTAFCWGNNAAGQLGDGTGQSRTSPTAVVGGHVFQSIGAGEAFTCGLRTDGRVYCWGSIAGATGQPVPFTYPAAPTFTALSVGSQHACALTADGVAYCWGLNGQDGEGRLGDGTTANRPAPTPVSSSLRFAEISAGYRHTCARTSDAGAVACWGRNASFELGSTAAAFELTPRYIVLGVTP